MNSLLSVFINLVAVFSAISYAERCCHRLHYNRRTQSRRVFIPWLSIWISGPMHVGNIKLSRDIAITSLKEGPAEENGVCLNCESCKAYCYAKKASVRPAVLVHRLVWSWVAINHPAFYFLCVRDDLKKMQRKKYPPKFVRIHEAGDFFSQDYINRWADVAADFPDFRFYYYTEVGHLFDFSRLVALDNVNPVSSRLPDGSLNFNEDPDNPEDIEERAKRNGVHICLYGTPQGKNIHCGSNCTWCMYHEYVAFYNHFNKNKLWSHFAEKQGVTVAELLAVDK